MYASGRRICTFLEGAQRGGRGIIAWRRALEKRDVRAEVEAMRRLLIVAQVEEGLGAVDVTRRTSCGLFFRAGAWSRRELPNAVILRLTLYRHRSSTSHFISSSAMAPTKSKSTPPSSAFHSLWQAYNDQTSDRLKFIDAFLVFIMFSGALQFLYCVLVTNFPFNAFLAGYVILLLRQC